MHHTVVKGDVAARADPDITIGVIGQLRPVRIDDDELCPALGRRLHVGRRDRMIGGGIGPGDQGDVAVFDVAKGRRYRPGADHLHQRGDRRGVAEAGAVIDVVGLKRDPDQLLKEVRLLVRALRGAKSGQRRAASSLADPEQTAGHQLQRLVPAGFAKMRQDLPIVDETTGPLAPLLPDRTRQRPLRIGLLAADQRLGQAVAVARVIKTVATLDAEPAIGDPTVTAVDPGDLVALAIDVRGDRTADTAIGAESLDLRKLGRWPQRRREFLVDQRVRRASVHAFTAGDAARVPHRHIEIKGDARAVALAAAADHLV